MQFTLNGQEKHYEGDLDRSLLSYLREQAGITSAKDGCAPQAACGACAVQVGGKAVLACVTKMARVAGADVVTVEGLSEYRQQVYSRAFVAKGGIQCGYCIPGIVMQADALINRVPAPTRSEIERSLTPHLCRCTGYKKIVEAIEYAAEAIGAEEEVPMPGGDGSVGSRQPKYDSLATVLGQRAFVDDITVPGLLYGALRFSDHPRAKVLAIDVSGAEQLPGVLRVLTAADIPGDRWVGLIKQDWPIYVACGEETRYIGDVLASVVAESEAIARAAATLIHVDYEVLDPVTDPQKALDPAAPAIHEGGNVLSRSLVRRGDLGAAESRSAYIVRGNYETQRIEHGFMEPEAALAYPSGDGVTVLSQGQGVYDDRDQIARLLGLAEDKVRVILVPNGGGFGGKEDLTVQGHAALMSVLTGSAVKVRLTREQSIVMHPKRHPMWMAYTVGCDQQGMLTFVKARIVGDTGAYASVGMKVLERAAGHATGMYHVPAVDIDAMAVYTNNIPCGAMRGFGVNQAAFALESCIDELCLQGGFDRWQFRFDNALDVGGLTATGQIITGGAGARATLLAVKEAYEGAKHCGLACGLKNTGIGNGMPDAAYVTITIASESRVIIDHGWTEMGQGVHTVALQTLCQETGLPPEVVEVRVDTGQGQLGGMTTASRATSLVGNATRDAAQKLHQDLSAATLAELTGRVYHGSWMVDWTTKLGQEQGEIRTHYSYSYATQLVILDDRGQITKVIAAHDAGKVYNPLLFEGQIEGSIHMGLGYALTEDLAMEDGRLVSSRLRDCGILRAKQMPEIEVIAVEVPDPYGPYGAKGVGEIGLVPTAAAVANALARFDGHRRTKLPLEGVSVKRVLPWI